MNAFQDGLHGIVGENGSLILHVGGVDQQDPFRFRERFSIQGCCGDRGLRIASGGKTTPLNASFPVEKNPLCAGRDQEEDSVFKIGPDFPRGTGDGILFCVEGVFFLFCEPLHCGGIVSRHDRERGERPPIFR